MDEYHRHGGDTQITVSVGRNHDTVGGQVAPVENTDYDANTQQCGGGADISSEPIRRRSRR